MASEPSFHFPQDLGDGLVLRRGRAADAEALAVFNARIHGEDGVGEWTRDLLAGSPPGFAPDDFTVVEDSASGQIVSSLCLIDQIWSYGGVPVGVGRPELVGTEPAYRNRGLVRKQMNVAHAWSRERGHLVQAITGIPYYYRQFGYEMALDLDGYRLGSEGHVPTLKEGESESLRIRPAGENDLAFVAECYASHESRALVSALRTPELWHDMLLGKRPGNINRSELRIIERIADGTRLGYVAHPGCLWGDSMALIRFDLTPGASWMEVTPAVIRYLWATGTAYAEKEGKPLHFFNFTLDRDHPAYHIAQDRLPRVRSPYAWYVRVPDLPAFLRAVAPALEARLAQSYCCGYSGTLDVNMYRSAVRMSFAQGRLTGVEALPGGEYEKADANFPDRTFLHILFGCRPLQALREMYPDCIVNEKGRNLLEALFPPTPSHVWGIS